MIYKDSNASWGSSEVIHPLGNGVHFEGKIKWRDEDGFEEKCWFSSWKKGYFGIRSDALSGLLKDPYFFSCSIRLWTHQSDLIYSHNQHIMLKYLPKTSAFRGSSPLLGKILVGTSAITAVLGAYSYLKSKGAVAEIEYRKSQLAKPIYKLTPEEQLSPPWNKDNLKDWLYRRGTRILIQWRWWAAQSIGCSASFPEKFQEGMDLSMWSHWCVGSSHLTAVKDKAWLYQKDSYHISTGILEIAPASKMLACKPLWDSWVNLRNCRIMDFFQGMLITMEDRNILMPIWMILWGPPASIILNRHH